MRKAVLTTAVLFLSSAWVIAQSSQYPSSQQPTAPTAPDASQTSPAAADKGGHSVEGCVGGTAGAYTLTDASGKTYQLAGDTSKLADHVGHQVQVSGSVDAGAAGAAAAGGQQTVTVKKVKMLSASCPNK